VVQYHSSLRGYFTEKGVLRKELILAEAELVASKFKKSNITMGQVRKFFLMARGIESFVTQPEYDFDMAIPEISRLKSQAAYLVGRASSQRDGTDPLPLKQFIDANIGIAILDRKSFIEGFLPHFESVVAYFTFHTNAQKNQNNKAGNKSYNQGKKPFDNKRR
jgi:CRISPR type III-A-associated protein Csm2